MLENLFDFLKTTPKISDAVVLKHVDWQKFKCASVNVHDAETGDLIFTDTLYAVYDWLDDRHYKWLGLPGLWGPIE